MRNSKIVISLDRINNAGIILNDTRRSLAERFHALFLLRNFKDDLSVEWICKCFSDSSALLKHELAYCLGQMKNTTAIPKLVEILEDKKQEAMVRHEAGEALAAIGDHDKKFYLQKILSKFINDPIKEVSETCQLALKMVQWKLENKETLLENQSRYNSIDPTPAADTKNVNIEELGRILIDQNKTLWDRYKALFALRNLNTDQATKKIAVGLFCEDSALFRHEVAYVLGQIQSPVAVEELKARLCMPMENGMVRHECAEALGSIATEECLQILKEFLNDEERVVRESCEVALEIFKQNGVNE